MATQLNFFREKSNSLNYIPSSIISLGNRELVALLLLCSECYVAVIVL